MSLILAILAVGAMFGGVVVFPIAYALGGEHTSRMMATNFRELRERRNHA